MVPMLKRLLLGHPRVFGVAVAAYGWPIRLRYGCTLRLGAGGAHFVLAKAGRELRLSIAHNAYIVDAAQRFDYYLDAVIPERISGLDIADFSEPRIHRVRGIDEAFLFTSFPESVEIAEAYRTNFPVKPGDVVIDAGAYCGLTAFLFSKAVGTGVRVIAVEADPHNFAALRANLAQHPAPNVQALHAAVWSENGVIEFASEGNMGSAAIAVAPGKPHRVGVPAKTLDQICIETGLQRVDHVKMDVEGAEYEVIPASRDFIERFRPDFLIEVHVDRGGTVNVPRLEKFFSAVGYAMRQVPQPGEEIFPLVHFFPRSGGSARR
jgi:FkbM family methyltransferase